MIVEVGPWQEVVQEAAERLYRALLTAPNRDQKNDFRLWTDTLAGKAVEVGAAVAFGIDPRVVLDDAPGSPDLIVGRWPVDVKALPRGKDRVTVRADVLHKRRLVVVGSRRDSHTVRLYGWTHTDALSTYPLCPPARGHGKPYAAMPLTDLHPLTEAAPHGHLTT